MTSDPGRASQATGFADGPDVLVLWRVESSRGPRIVLGRLDATNRTPT